MKVLKPLTTAALDKRLIMAFKEVILHIGYHKTATSFFQRSYYPAVKNYLYVNRFWVQKHILNPSPFSYDSRNVIQELNGKSDKEADRIILCEEEMLGHIHNGGFNGCGTKVIAERLKETFPDAKVVVFLRNQIDIIGSAYRQYVRQGGNYSVNRYLYHPDNNNFITPLFSFEHFDYSGVLRFYKRLFGDNLHVYLYEDFAKDNKGFIEKYTADMGLNLDCGKLKFKQYNPGISNAAINIAKVVNLFNPRGTKIYKYTLIGLPLPKIIFRGIKRGLDQLHRRRGQGADYIQNAYADNLRLLGPRNVEFIRNFYRESNAGLVEEFGFAVAQYGYPL